MLKQIANEVWKKCMTEISKDDNKQILDNYIYKPVNNTLSEVKMYFILLISVQIIITILILLIVIMFFIHAKDNNK
jgi:hypothetical protein